jgi:hypothetical protein
MSVLLNTFRAAGLAAILAAGLPMVSGCGGGGATFQATGNKTLGEELQDLQASYDKGIITKKQYEDTKKRLIKKYTK